ncbi:MAG: DUF5654 family protein [Candidatus Berkelbacteria bacterium]|nr:DUF5654 family protein [Candidatus Berkelbacteria bacterium]
MPKEKVQKEVKKIKSEFVKTLTTFVVSAFGLVAALAWNKAITEIISKYLTPGSSIISWILYAILVTIVAVLVTIYLGRLTEKFKIEEENEKKGG